MVLRRRTEVVVWRDPNQALLLSNLHQQRISFSFESTTCELLNPSCSPGHCSRKVCYHCTTVAAGAGRLRYSTEPSENKKL